VVVNQSCLKRANLRRCITFVGYGASSLSRTSADVGGFSRFRPQFPESETETLLKLLADPDRPEDHLAIRGEDIYVVRLVQQSCNPSQPLSLESNATYLITGDWEL
jgi:hypothetical protein